MHSNVAASACVGSVEFVGVSERRRASVTFSSVVVAFTNVAFVPLVRVRVLLVALVALGKAYMGVHETGGLGGIDGGFKGGVSGGGEEGGGDARTAT